MKVKCVDRIAVTKSGEIIEKTSWNNCNFSIDSHGVILSDKNFENRTTGKIEEITTGMVGSHQLKLTVLVDLENYDDYDVYVREEWFVKF